MKSLFLVRHAHAAEGGDDHQRRLTARGERSADVAAAPTSNGEPVQIHVAEGLRSALLRGFEPDLQSALEELMRVGVDFAGIGCGAEIRLEALEDALSLSLILNGPGLGDWQLPRTFEPYYLNRVLRGSPHGLSLFLVRTVVHAHGGQALAQRDNVKGEHAAFTTVGAIAMQGFRQSEAKLGEIACVIGLAPGIR